MYCDGWLMTFMLHEMDEVLGGVEKEMENQLGRTRQIKRGLSAEVRYNNRARLDQAGAGQQRMRIRGGGGRCPGRKGKGSDVSGQKGAGFCFVYFDFVGEYIQAGTRHAAKNEHMIDSFLESDSEGVRLGGRGGGIGIGCANYSIVTFFQLSPVAQSIIRLPMIGAQ